MLNKTKINELIKNTNIDVSNFSDFDFQILELNNTYNFINPLEIKKFIYENKQFIDFFNEITPILKKQYPNNNYSLEFLVDPENDDLNQIELIINVNSKDTNSNSVVSKWRELNKNLRDIEKKYDLMLKFGTNVELV